MSDFERCTTASKDENLRFQVGSHRSFGDLAEHVVSRLGDDPSGIGDGLNVTRWTVSITCNKSGIGTQGDGRRTRVNRVSVGSDVYGSDQTIRGVVVRRGVVNESGNGSRRFEKN